MLITYQANYILLNNTFDLFKTPFNLHENENFPLHLEYFNVHRFYKTQLNATISECFGQQKQTYCGYLRMERQWRAKSRMS